MLLKSDITTQKRMREKCRLLALTEDEIATLRVNTLQRLFFNTLQLLSESAFGVEVKWLHLPPPHHAEIKRLHASYSRFALFTPLSLFLLLLLTHIEQSNLSSFLQFRGRLLIQAVDSRSKGRNFSQ
ncbi:hypothetical protein ACSBR2_001532 [Camellia fascicularis]